MENMEYIVETEERVVTVRRYRTTVHAPDSETAAKLFFDGVVHERKFLREVSQIREEPLVVGVDERKLEDDGD